MILIILLLLYKFFAKDTERKEIKKINYFLGLSNFLIFVFVRNVNV